MRQVIVWDVDANDIEQVNDMLMGEFKEPRDDGPVMEWYEMNEIGVGSE